MFRGSTLDNYAENFQSDFGSSGYTAWVSIKANAQLALQAIENNPAYAGYQILTDGHSLGGGMAQTFALENDLSGYGQNSLPISPGAIANDPEITGLGGLTKAVSIWSQAGNTFSEVNLAGDPATFYYSTVQGLYYLSTTTKTLANPYAAGEADGAILLTGGPILAALGVALEGLSAYESHSIGTVVSLEQNLSQTSSGDTATVNQDVNADNTNIITAINADNPEEGSSGILTATEPSGPLVAVTLTSSTTNTDIYNITSGGQPAGVLLSINAGTGQTYDTAQLGVNLVVDLVGGNTIDVSSLSVTTDAPTDTLNISASNATITIENPGSFSGTISNFDGGDTIDLVGFSATGGTITTNGMLTVQETGGGTLALNVDPVANTETVYALSDGSGGTDLVLTEPVPVTSAPQTMAVNAGVATPLSGLSVAIPTGPSVNESITTTLSSSNGTFAINAVNGIVANGSGTDTLAISGNISDINSDLNNILFTPSSTPGNSIITVQSKNDQGGGDSRNISVSSVSPDQGGGIGYSVATYSNNVVIDFNYLGLLTASLSLPLYVNLGNIPANYGGILIPVSFVPQVYGGHDDPAIQASGSAGNGISEGAFFDSIGTGEYSGKPVQAEFLIAANNPGIYQNIPVDLQITFGDLWGPTDLNPLIYASATVYVSANVACFLPGTCILTDRGEVPVERLGVGDVVITHDGSQRRLCWIGKGQTLATRGRRTAATPILIRKGALASNVPHQDLRVTKGHSLFLDDVLIPVEFLINHRSILWDDRAQEVTVYHLELDTHDVLLANGAPAESYRDDGNRWLFQNANAGWHLPPKPPYAPVLTGGPIVDAIWRRLLDRAGPRPVLPVTDDPDLHLVVDRKRVDALRQDQGMQVFRLQTQPGSVRLLSRATVPQELGFARDPRSLGVAVQRIVLAGRRRTWTIEANSVELVDGYHTYESDNGIRWTDGDAAIPDRLFASMDSPCLLMIYLGGATRYLDEGQAVKVA